MTDAGSTESTAAAVTTDDLDLLSALDVGEGGEDTDGGKGAGKGDETNGADDSIAAKGKEADTGDKGSKGEGDDDEEPKWFEDGIADLKLRKFASGFETKDALIETMSGLQKALGVESVEDWRKDIEGDQLKEHAGRFTSPADVVKRHFELRQKLSSALIPPGKGASKEDREIFAARLSKVLGVPEKPEDYEFPVPVEGTELTDVEKQSRANWAGFFHQIHLPKPMASAILKRFAEETVEGEKAIQEADDHFAEKSVAQLEREWGDEYDTNRTTALRAGKEFFGEDFDSVMEAVLSDGHLLMDSTFMLRGLARIGRETNEGGIDIMTDAEKETIDDQVVDMRKRANDAKEAGDTRLANKLFSKEQELLEKIVGKTPIVGAGGRTT